MFGRDEKVSAIRLTAVQYLILAIFLLLTYGLWRLQVSRSELYASLAEKNRIREVPILAPRGRILDREGRTIVDNYASFTALLMRDSNRDLSADADLIAQGLHMDAQEVRSRVRKFAALPQYQPIYLKDDITQDELSFIESHRNELPELDTIMAHRRLYPRKGFMAHLIGYVGEVSEQMLNQAQWDLYNPGDVVGKSGVELEYNSMLMGQNGSKQVVVNSHGKEMGELGEKPATAGKALKLTVDIDLQIAAEEAIEGKNGAIIAMDPHTGEILAMVNQPSFNPNAHAADPAYRRNRALTDVVEPGSTMKAFTVATALESGKWTPDSKVDTSPGYYQIGSYTIHDVHDHGMLTLTSVITKSSNIGAAKVAESLSRDSLYDMFHRFGFGESTGSGFPGESPGFLPVVTAWGPVEKATIAYGYGLNVTSLQIAQAYAALANAEFVAAACGKFGDDGTLIASLKPVQRVGWDGILLPRLQHDFVPDGEGLFFSR